MAVEIVGNSTNAQALVKSAPRGSYPFEKLQEGQSFIVPLDQANVRSLRTRCSQLNANGKRYVVVVHPNVVEVARLPVATEEVSIIQSTNRANLESTNQSPHTGKTPQDFINPNASFDVSPQQSNTFNVGNNSNEWSN